MQRNSYSYHGTPYERCTTPVARELRQGYADWFRTFDWSFYLTLIFSRDKKRNHADFLLEEYLREIERHIRAPLSCLIAPEEKYSGLGMPAGRAHFHLLVGCGFIFPPSTFVNTWRQPNYGGTWVSKRKGQILDIFIDIKAEQPGDQLVSASTSQITVISLRVHDGLRFIEIRLEASDEAQLLRQFWLFITPRDLFIDPQVKYEVDFIRQRSSALGLFPASTE